MEGNELYSFRIIASVGGARSCYIEAIQEAKKGNLEDAKRLVAEGEEMFIEGHKAHSEMIQKEAAGEFEASGLLLMHAEDQLMSAEGFKTIAEEFIDVYDRLLVVEERLSHL
ncbi:MAG TPA: PTS lactose/cellobiose transporter subunit IIA [Enterococcus sp.]|nr:PTS lactose/cellobiose transporter subunit IIA [Enterococcus sp.]